MNKDDILKYIIDFSLKSKRNPKISECSTALLPFSKRLVYKEFGSWRAALMEAGLDTDYYAVRGERISCKCSECGIPVFRRKLEIKSDNIFCSQGCAASYNNKHKKYGTRVSKLELWLQDQLVSKYPSIRFSFNEKKHINSELDIYIPNLRLAFELNGIFHYEPIFGEDKLLKIQNNDNRKYQACLERGIELCIIDTSSFSYFKLERALYFLSIITGIIEAKLLS